MKKIELVKALAKVMGISQTEASKKIADIDVIVETVAKEMKVGERTDIGNYIALEKKVQAAKTARNPKTGEAIEIDEKVVVKVKARKPMKSL